MLYEWHQSVRLFTEGLLPPGRSKVTCKQAIPPTSVHTPSSFSVAITEGSESLVQKEGGLFLSSCFQGLKVQYVAAASAWGIVLLHNRKTQKGQRFCRTRQTLEVASLSNDLPLPRERHSPLNGGPSLPMLPRGQSHFNLSFIEVKPYSEKG